MVSAFISRVVILVFGTLYPAYKSYKAVKTKNVKEYVKWMMYWIVFALFTFVETFADLFVAWLPFYYELKILFVLWLLSPATKGASILYRKFIHPQLSKREQEIDAHLDRVTDQGYAAVLSLGSKGFNYATNVVLTTAIKGQAKLAENLKRSYSLNDVSEDKEEDVRDVRGQEIIQEVSDEDEADNRMIEESYQREMQEKDIDTTEPVRRRRAKKEELGQISEGEEADTKKSNFKRAYSNKDRGPTTRSSKIH